MPQMVGKTLKFVTVIRRSFCAERKAERSENCSKLFFKKKETLGCFFWWLVEEVFCVKEKSIPVVLGMLLRMCMCWREGLRLFRRLDNCIDERKLLLIWAVQISNVTEDGINRDVNFNYFFTYKAIGMKDYYYPAELFREQVIKAYSACWQVS